MNMVQSSLARRRARSDQPAYQTVQLWIPCALKRAGLVLWLAVSTLCSPARVPAQASGRASIALRPGVTCLDDARLRQQLESWLDRPAPDLGLQIDVQGSVDDPRSVLVRLYMAGSEVARRDFSPGPASCEDLHDAVALAIALMIKVADGAPAAAKPLPEHPSEPRPPVPPSLPVDLPPDGRAALRAAPPTADARPSSTSAHAASGELSLRASGLFAAGAHKSAAGGFRSELSVAVARALELRVGLIGFFSLARRLSNTEGTYTTRELAGTVAACVVSAPRASLQLRLCAELWAGRMRANGASFDPPLAARLPWSSAALQLELDWRLSADWALLLAGSPVVSLLREQVVARNADDAIIARAELPRFSAVLGIGLAYTFSHPGVR
jgi:hypothetical protein